MIYIDEVKNLRLYSKEFLLPRNGKDKKKNNAVFLLTPNFESSNTGNPVSWTPTILTTFRKVQPFFYI